MDSNSQRTRVHSDTVYQATKEALNRRGVTIEDIAKIVYEMQLPYNDGLTMEHCEESVKSVLKKREMQHAILVGIELDELAEELVSLHKKLTEVDYQDSEQYAFVPHITIAQKMTSSEHDDIYPQLKMIGAKFEEVIDRIHLLYQLDDGSWTVHETFRLSGE